MEQINFNAPHVVFINTAGEVVFAEKSKNYHEGLTVLDTFDDFESADFFAKREIAEREYNYNKSMQESQDDYDRKRD